MKSVALLVLYVGYVLVAYGVNHVTGGCVSFKDTIWPVGTQLTDPCGSTKTTTTTSTSGNTQLTSAQQQQLNAAGIGSANASTVNPTTGGSGNNFHITGQKTTTKQQYPYTNLLSGQGVAPGVQPLGA